MGQHPGTDGFIANYNAGVAERLSGEPASRNPAWTESLAVGSHRYVREMEGWIPREIGPARNANRNPNRNPILVRGVSWSALAWKRK